MRSSLLKETLKSFFPNQRTVAIEGPPGGGKTTVVRAVAQELDVPYIEKHMPTMLVEDFGIPYPAAEGNTFGYKMPDWFPAVGSQYDNNGQGGILCFDDRNQASADLQKVLANICQARNLHGVPMAKGWMVISTGNRQSDRAGSNRVLSHLRGRETILEYETHLDDWTKWALDNNVQSELIAFIRFRPGLLHDFDPQRDQNPSPRSWVEGVGAAMGIVPAEAEYECFKGAVGEGAAAEFLGFLKVYRKLPNVDAVLLDPKGHELPTDPATKYALTGAIANRAANANFDRVLTVADRLGGDFSVLTVQLATRRDRKLVQTAAFTRWATDNSDILI